MVIDRGLGRATIALLVAAVPHKNVSDRLAVYFESIFTFYACLKLYARDFAPLASGKQPPAHAVATGGWGLILIYRRLGWSLAFMIVIISSALRSRLWRFLRNGSNTSYMR